jgi:hypothetical protein
VPSMLAVRSIPTVLTVLADHAECVEHCFIREAGCGYSETLGAHTWL